MRPIRVSLLVGGLSFAVATGWVVATERHSNFRGRDGLALLTAMAAFALVVGSLVTVGTFMGLRTAPAERLSYKTALSIVLVYFAFTYLTYLIPVDFFRVPASGLQFWIRFVGFPVVMCCVAPYLITLTWRLTIVGGGREAR